MSERYSKHTKGLELKSFKVKDTQTIGEGELKVIIIILEHIQTKYKFVLDITPTSYQRRNVINLKESMERARKEKMNELYYKKIIMELHADINIIHQVVFNDTSSKNQK